MPGIAQDGSEDLPWETPKVTELPKPAPEYNLGEELYEKTFVTLRHLVSSVQAGKITEEQFSTGIDTLFMAVSGLVPEYTGRPRFIDAITACHDEAKNCYPIIRRCFYNPIDKVFKVYTWQAGDDYIKMRVIGANTPGLRKVECESPAAAQAKLQAIGNPAMLKKLNFVEV